MPDELDLHGYAVSSAREIAQEFVKAAWEAGYDHVVLIHGARNDEASAIRDQLPAFRG
jgi:DNA-nicking Smr family endonuclease